jgi:hypothetical protein
MTAWDPVGVHADRRPGGEGQAQLTGFPRCEPGEQLVDQAAGCWDGRVEHPLGATISTTICIAWLHHPSPMSQKAGDLRFLCTVDDRS